MTLKQTRASCVRCERFSNFLSNHRPDKGRAHSVDEVGALFFGLDQGKGEVAQIVFTCAVAGDDLAIVGREEQRDHLRVVCSQCQ